MNWNRGHSPPFQGGVAATPRSGRGGCVSDENHPGCASQGTGPFLGGAQPPLLGKEGNAHDSNSFTPSTPANSLTNGESRWSARSNGQLSISLNTNLNSTSTKLNSPCLSLSLHTNAASCSIDLRQTYWISGLSVWCTSSLFS